jgi:hypothetical protein
MAPQPDRHIDEAEVERYSLSVLPEKEAAPIEEHLLVCDSCRVRLAETDLYVEAMRRAAGLVASSVEAAKR